LIRSFLDVYYGYSLCQKPPRLLSGTFSVLLDSLDDALERKNEKKGKKEKRKKVKKVKKREKRKKREKGKREKRSALKCLSHIFSLGLWLIFLPIRHNSWILFFQF
jgi:hypothetical protein